MTLACGAGETYKPPEGFTLIEIDLLGQIMDKITELQAWQADYERLREKERIEMLEPLPAFVDHPDFKHARNRAS